MDKPIELASDGHARLTLDADEQALGKDTYALVMSDGGGFSSVFVTKQDLKDLVDKLNEVIRGWIMTKQEIIDMYKTAGNNVIKPFIRARLTSQTKDEVTLALRKAFNGVYRFIPECDKDYYGLVPPDFTVYWQRGDAEVRIHQGLPEGDL